MHLIEMTNTDVVLRPSPYLTKQQKSGDVPREGCLSFSKLGNCQENALIVDFYYYKVRGRCGGDAKNYGLEMGKTIYFPLHLKMKNEVKLEAYFVPNCLLPLNIERYMFWCNADDTYCYGNEDQWEEGEPIKRKVHVSADLAKYRAKRIFPKIAKDFFQISRIRFPSKYGAKDLQKIAHKDFLGHVSYERVAVARSMTESPFWFSAILCTTQFAYLSELQQNLTFSGKTFKIFSK